MKNGTKLLISGVLAILLTIGFCLTAAADPSAKNVTIQEVYVDDMGVVTLKVVKRNGSTATLTAPADEKNQVMALALTAVSLNKQVRIVVEWEIPDSELVSITLVNE